MYRYPLLSLTTMAMIATQATCLTTPPPQYDVTVDSMVTVIFTGDSQSCGRNLAIDFPQLLSRSLPARVINTAVGGSNSSALLEPMTGGTLTVQAGEKVVYGKKVRWGMGAFPGMRISIHGEDYTIDHVDEHPPSHDTEIYLREAARSSYAGADYAIEPGWQVRVAQWKPDVVCLMYINDGAINAEAEARWREMVRRIRALDAVPVLMSPVPVDDALHGGNHPGNNNRFASNAAAIRKLATELNCWFVDVFDLYWKLDPPLRGVVADGIHPDTDGARLITNGLSWVFERMGLLKARPFIKGWHAKNAATSLSEMLAEARPFHTSQPDHPDPDHQNEAGFTLAARLENDDYALLAESDGNTVRLGSGILLRFGITGPPDGRNAQLHLTGRGLGEVRIWDPAKSRWEALQSEDEARKTVCSLATNKLTDGLWHLLVTPGRDDGELDEVRLRIAGSAPPPWRPTGPARQYEITSDHTKPDNLLPNADFTSETAAWTLVGDATRNTPFSAEIAGIAFPDSGKSRSVHIPNTVPVRPYDMLDVQGSQQQNDGCYRIRKQLTATTYQVRRRPKGEEAGLRGTLIHDHGCGLVPGGSCVEMRGNGTASLLIALSKTVASLRTSFFFRVVHPESLGTRDVPGRQARIEWAFFDSRNVLLETVTSTDLECSYQWQKAALSHSVPKRTAKVELTLAAQSKQLVQYTGIYLAPDPR